MKIKNLISLLLFLCATAPQAALFSRGGGTMVYDDVLDVTWLADANYAQTSGHDADGRMTWDNAVAWADGLSFGGYNDWRLPDVKPVDGSNTFNTTFSNNGSTDIGYNITSVNSELAYMYYVNLGNNGLNDTSGNPTGCSGSDPFCLTNTSPFSNLQSFVYWSGVEFAPSPAGAWSFNTQGGFQGGSLKDNQFYAWAVRSGDVTASSVPVPAAFWLFGSALIGVVGLKRKR